MPHAAGATISAQTRARRQRNRALMVRKRGSLDESGSDVRPATQRLPGKLDSRHPLLSDFPLLRMTGGGGGVSRGRAARVGIGIGLRFRGTDVVVGAESVHRTLFARFDCTIHAREHAGVDHQAWRARVFRRCSAG